MYGNQTRFILNRQAEQRAEKYAKWAREYETALLAQRPALRGRIDWTTAQYMYSQDWSVERAVQAACAITPPEPAARARERADIANGCLP